MEPAHQSATLENNYNVTCFYKKMAVVTIVRKCHESCEIRFFVSFSHQVKDKDKKIKSNSRPTCVFSFVLIWMRSIYICRAS